VPVYLNPSVQFEPASFLGYTAGGLGYLAVAHLLGIEAKGASPKVTSGFHPLAPKAPHFPARPNR